MPIFKHCAKFAQCFFHAVLAQLAERQSPKPEAAGSSPADGATQRAVRTPPKTDAAAQTAVPERGYALEMLHNAMERM